MADLLPEDTLYTIFSRIPIESLFRFRRVCKQWREYIDDPHLANIHHVKGEPKPLHHGLIERESIFHQQVSVLSFLRVTADGVQVKEDFSSRFLVKRNSINMELQIKGYCHGLITLLRQEHRRPNRGTTFVVINPLTKDCHDLPRLNRPDHETIRGQGLGFDNSTSTFKMVCVLSNNRVKVHILGTDSWREIPQVPYKYMCGEAVYANGRLHWYAGGNSGENVVWLDMKKEKFGLTNFPKQSRAMWFMQLVDLNGDVGCVYRTYRRNGGDEVVVWILKHEDQWTLVTLHCAFKLPDNYDGEVDIGCWNKDGDILIRGWIKNALERQLRLVVYRPKNDSFHSLGSPEVDPGELADYYNIRMYQSSLLSMRKWH